MSKISFAIASIVILFSISPAFSLDEILLPLPPVQIDDSRKQTVSKNIWLEIEQYYYESVLGIGSVSINKMISEWRGDTITIDFYDISEAMRLGQEFDADQVLLTEIDIDGILKMIKVDPWSGETSNEILSPSTIEAIRELESENWIYGTQFNGIQAGYKPPDVKGGERNINRLMHEKSLFPQEAIIQGLACRAEVVVIVSNKGVPIEVKIKRVNQPGYEFEEAFEKLLWSIEYKPATIGTVEVVGKWEATLLVKTVVD